jgi:battenin
MNDDETVTNLPVRHASILANIKHTTRRIQPLVVPYMAPLFLVYVSEYTINQVSLNISD